MAVGLLAGPKVAPAAPSHRVVASDWTVYHGEPSGSGLATSPTSLWPLSRSPLWRSAPVNGDLYGEPLVEGNRVYVATEADDVYALSADRGTVVWHRSLGAAVPARDLPCGDIEPTVGVTGTPVIDPERHELFAVADQMAGVGIEHVLYGLDLSTGKTLLAQPVDPPGTVPADQLQRTGLNLDDGEVVFGYGGNYGDCGEYHGWVVAVPEGGGALKTFEVASGPGESQGAVWMGGAAPEVDAGGNIWVATGNGSATASHSAYDDGDGVLELDAELRLEQFFAPVTWRQDNADDLDLGSSSPALAAGGLALQAGKSSTAFLLRRSDLGGVGQPPASAGSVCDGEVDGGTAVVGQTVLLPCESGIVAVRVSGGGSPGISTRWRSAGGAGGAVVQGRYLYAVDRGAGTLDVMRLDTGAVVRRAPIGTPANHFPTPSAVDGLLLVATADRVLAFDGPSGAPPAPTQS
jgi:PQQ-like domain